MIIETDIPAQELCGSSPDKTCYWQAFNVAEDINEFKKKLLPVILAQMVWYDADEPVFVHSKKITDNWPSLERYRHTVYQVLEKSEV